VSLKWFVFLIPAYSIIYITAFYDHFKILRFKYFNPVDFLRVFYENNALLLILLVVTGFMFLGLKILYESQTEKSLYLNAFLVILLIVVFICFLLTTDKIYQAIISLMLIIILIGLMTKKLDNLFYGLLVSYLSFAYFIGKYNARKIEKYKPRFDILLKDNTYLLKEVKTKYNDYFIEKSTDYIFIYSDSLKKVRAISTSEIKEIRFTLKQ
jgi:hypothetical protein